MKLDGKVAVVTGAGRNIGEAIVRLFSEEGAKVAVVDMDPGRGGKVADDLNKSEHRAIAVTCDVSHSDDVQAMVKRVVGEWGRLDILVNNAAVTDGKNILDVSEEEWDKVIAVTLKGPFLVSKYVAQQMVEQGDGGKIINVVSTSGHMGRPGAISYSAAKGGVLNLTRSMAIQLAPYNIRVNSISPNRTGSPVGKEEVRQDGEPKNLSGRWGQPIDQAKAILFLASDESDFIYGANLPVDGGILAIGPW